MLGAAMYNFVILGEDVLSFIILTVAMLSAVAPMDWACILKLYTLAACTIVK